MAENLVNLIPETPKHGLAGLALEFSTTPAQVGAPAAARAACFHCGEPCPDDAFTQAEKTFCCQGCLVVHDLLAESGLEQFYDLSRHPGSKIRAAAKLEQWAYLDEPAVQEKLLDFTDGKLSRVTFHIPAIHCIACVWLLENLFRLHPGIGKSQVNFPRREVAISFGPGKIRLSELAGLLASIGYEPHLTLGELDKGKPDLVRRRQWLQVGVAGFAFGNIMLFSLPSYLGLDSFSGPLFQQVFGWLSLALAAPVVCYSASDYWRSALLSLRQRILTLDVPIALGLAALYVQSAWEVWSGRGVGYLDSLAGLVFFLLCGRVFQQKTFDRLAFDRDYKCFFPLSVVRRTADGEENVAISQLIVGDRLRLRNGELVPADARLVSGTACIDYSFVTGESEPVTRQPGDYLYAGGKQVGGALEVEIVKPVSQSYLTSLWNHEAFQKDRLDNLNTQTNRYSRRFTRLVIVVALGAALFWVLSGDATRGLKAFTSVLIVACPCALALAAPFTLGTAQRWLARLQAFLRNPLVIERMAQVDTIVFDKTGTLTAAENSTVEFHAAERSAPVPGAETSKLTGALAQTNTPAFSHVSAAEDGRAPGAISKAPSPLRSAGALHKEEASWVAALARHSTHPLAQRIGELLGGQQSSQPVLDFIETAGAGLAGTIEGHQVRLGSRAWLAQAGISVPETALPPGSVSHLAIDGAYRGAFVLTNPVRPETDRLLAELGRHYEIALLSGDNEKERERFRHLFGSQAHLQFNQSPLDKLGFIRQLQEAGKTVMMVGDGLNDAGALKQSDVGVAVVEKVGAFSPASDVILAASQVPRLFELLTLARRSARIVRWSFGVSALYNLVGISIAAAGILSPLICAVLMPLSSITVVLFACGVTSWTARNLKLAQQ